MNLSISIATWFIVGIGVITSIAGGMLLASFLLTLACGYFKKAFMEWKLVIDVVQEAKRQGRSVFKGDDDRPAK